MIYIGWRFWYYIDDAVVEFSSQDTALKDLPKTNCQGGMLYEDTYIQDTGNRYRRSIGDDWLGIKADATEGYVVVEQSSRPSGNWTKIEGALLDNTTWHSIMDTAMASKVFE